MKRTSILRNIATVLITVILLSALASCGTTDSTGVKPNAGSPNSSDSGNNNTSNTQTDEITVTFSANGGVFSDGKDTYTQKVKAGEAMVAPESPTRQDHSFKGWSRQMLGGDIWDFSSDTAQSDITLYAKWTQKSATIFSVDGAAINDTEIFMLVDHNTSSVSLSNKVICSEDSVWKLYYDKLGQTEIPTKIAASMTGTLQNGDNTFYMVVTSNDGTQVNVYELTVHRSYPVPINYCDGEGVIKTENAYTGYEYSVTYKPSITGYTFIEWQTSGGSTVTSLTPWEPQYLYAKKTANQYKVTYNANGGSLNETEKTLTYGKSYTFPVPTRTGYTFTGWYTASNTQLTDSRGNSVSPWQIANDTTAKATWSVNTYELSLNNSNSVAGTVSGAGDYDYGQSVTVNATTNNGYTWLGWYDGDTKLTDKLSYTFTMPAKNVTYTAKWITRPITVEKNISAAGFVSGVPSTSIVGHQVTITANTNSGYTWLGWYHGDTKLTDELAYTFVMPTDEITYTAKWTYYTLSTNTSLPEGGSYTQRTDYKVTAGQSTTVTATTNNGYTFVGWYDGETKLTGELSYTFVMPAENITYTARFELKSEMANFNFTSTATACNITGVKDTTVTEIVVPDYVTSISQGAFSGCSSLESITLPFVGDRINTSSDYYQYPFGYIFGTSSYEGGVATEQSYYGSSTSSTTRTTYYIPSTLKSVIITGGNVLFGAFYNCSGLTSITIPNSVTSIGKYAFWRCTNLTSITIPNSVTRIYESAFRGCASLESVTIGNDVESIGDYAFDGCYKLVEVYNLSSLTIEKGSTSNGYVGYYALDIYTSADSESKLHTTNDGYIFYVDGSTVYLIGYTGSSTELVLPSGYNGHNYEINKYAFFSNTNLESVTIGDSVMSIGRDAFYNCTSLNAVYITDIAAWCEINFASQYANPLYYAGNLYLNGSVISGNIVIPEGTTAIGTYAFYNYSQITGMKMPDSVTSIGNSAFNKCTSLKSITIPDSVTSIGSDAFEYCTSLESITIPDSVTSIGSNAFYGCTSLKSITIPDSVTSIGYDAFEDCKSLKSVTIGNGVESIPGGLLGGCLSLESITLPFVGGSVKTSSDTYQYPFGYIFGSSSYNGGVDTTQSYYGSSTSSDESHSYYIPSTLKSVTITGGNILYGAFWGCSNLESIIIGDSVASISRHAFYKCSSLVYNEYDNGYYLGNENNKYLVLVKARSEDITSCQIHENTKFIYEDAFSGCTSLASITIPDGVRSIGNEAFSGCKSLERVIIPDSVTSIGDWAFEYCTSLESVTIGNNVDSIGERAFLCCTSLESVTIGNNVESIGSDAFYDCTSLKSITIPDSVTSIGSAAFLNCKSLESIIVGSGNIKYHSAGNCLIETSTKTLMLGCKNSVIPTDGSVMRIGGYAFYNCTSLKSITIPDSVTSIGRYAFEDCTSLESVNIPNSVTSIGDYAFKNCDSLESITIPDSVTSIGRQAFRACTSLKSITIPNSVTSIGDWAFEYCTSLESITFTDTSTWYRTTSYSDWLNETGGTKTDVTNPSTIVAYFNNRNISYFWYKK